MKVKALCKIIYGGKMYGFGDIFEADKAIPNTLVIDPAPADEPERSNAPDFHSEDGPDMIEETDRESRRGRNLRRGRGEPDERD